MSNNYSNKLNKLVLKQNQLCIWCGEKMYSRNVPNILIMDETGVTTRKEVKKLRANIEHIKPKSLNGKNAIYNLAAAHKGCNSKRSDKLINPNFKVLNMLGAQKIQYFKMIICGG